jgi:hypothetical protein
LQKTIKKDFTKNSKAHAIIFNVMFIVIKIGNGILYRYHLVELKLAKKYVRITLFYTVCSYIL